jgi:hypothetical protein
MLRDNKSEGGDSTDSTHSSASDKTPSLMVDTSTPTTIPDFIEEDEIDTYTNHPLVERAFEVSTHLLLCCGSLTLSPPRNAI